MKTAAIIAEFNPYHNGHEYLINKIKKDYGVTHVIAFMSGDFVERGAPAFFDKFTRARAALMSGCDIIFELPAVYALSSAKDFAFGGICLAEATGCVDCLAFGSESGDISELKELALFLRNETPDFKKRIESFLKQGKNYPEAVSLASGSDLLRGANNTLAVEYINSLYAIGSGIEPITIKRHGTEHDSNDVFSDSENELEYTSAGNIRRMILEKNERFLSMIPEVSRQVIQKASDCYMTTDDFSLILSLTIDRMSVTDLQNLPSSSHDIAVRIKQNNAAYCDITALSSSVSTKCFTESRINRVLMQALLGLSFEETDEFPGKPRPSYLRLLGMKKSASDLMKEIKKSATVPIITKVADRELADERMIMQDISSSNLYNKVRAVKYGFQYRSDIIKSPEII